MFDRSFEHFVFDFYDLFDDRERKEGEMEIKILGKKFRTKKEKQRLKGIRERAEEVEYEEL